MIFLNPYFSSLASSLLKVDCFHCFDIAYSSIHCHLCLPHHSGTENRGLLWSPPPRISPFPFLMAQCFSASFKAINHSRPLETSTALSFQDISLSWFSAVLLAIPALPPELAPPHQIWNVDVLRTPSASPFSPCFPSLGNIVHFQKFKYHFYSRPFSYIYRSSYPDF